MLRTLGMLQALPPTTGWWWEGFLLPGTVSMLAAYPRVGKTTLLFPMMKAMMSGTRFLDLPTRRPKTILYVSEEDHGLIVSRCERFGFNPDWPILWQLIEPNMGWARITALAALPAIDIIIIDSLSRFWGVENESDAALVNKAIAPIQTIARDKRKSVLLVHHTTKAGGPAGTGIRSSSALMANVDIPMELGRIHPWDLSSKRRLQTWSRYGETPDLIHLDYSDELGWKTVDGDAATVEGGVLKCLGDADGATQDDMAEATGFSVSRISAILSQLSGRGIIVKTGTGGKSSPFRYSLTGG